MENIQKAIISAIESKPLDFKTSIADELQAKIYDALQNRKIELAGSLFNSEEEQETEIQQTEFETSSEGNVDEDL